MTTKKFNKLDPAGLSIAGDNIAWATANKATWLIIGAAKMQHAENMQAVERPKFENILLVNGVREMLSSAANIVNSAEIDGIGTNLLEEKMHEQMDDAFIINVKQLERIKKSDKTRAAIGELTLEMGIEFVELSDKDQDSLTVERVQRMKIAAKKTLIIACDSRNEYRDVCEHFARCITDAPSADVAISGDGDVTEYLAVRENAVQTRLTSLKSNSTKIDGEWKNRYDNNGHLDASVVSELNGHFTILLAEAIKVGIDVSKIEALPDQATIDAIATRMKAA